MAGTDPETTRVREMQDDSTGWRRWGPYLSDRAWGTVREDYSPHGDAWRFLSYDLSRAKTYRWGEDGIAGLCDRFQGLCFAPAFWNGRDCHLKERLFGLTPHDGNHGEDVKECYYHVDSTPSHAYMAMLYRYPQASFPYNALVEENRRREGSGPEFELVDTGIFDEDRFFDVLIEYAKASPEEIAIRISVTNRGPDPAEIHLLPTLWFRNTWSWDGREVTRPTIHAGESPAGTACLVADDTGVAIDPRLPPSARLGRRWLIAAAPSETSLLFTDNETNSPLVFGGGHTSRSPFTKDAFHRLICDGETAACNPAASGTKAGVHVRLVVPAGETVAMHLMLGDRKPQDLVGPDVTRATVTARVDSLMATRRHEADLFHASVAPPDATADERHVQRRALAGLLWSKQNYIFDVATWLDGDNPNWPPPASRRGIRNVHWRHLNSMRVMSMPDAWEYPWFAAWDLAFHCIPFALVDPQFAKDQLWMLLFEQFQHPSGQLPAYEWEFSDLNPPVHAWAVWRVYNMEKRQHGKDD